MLKFNSLQYRYPSRRTVAYGMRGMVAASQPPAAQAGLEVLKKGGNAVDAAVAAAACLAVVEPMWNGVGGDSFALVWSGGKLHGLNASGNAPRAADAEILRSAGLKEMPRFGWHLFVLPVPILF